MGFKIAWDGNRNDFLFPISHKYMKEWNISKWYLVKKKKKKKRQIFFKEA